MRTRATTVVLSIAVTSVANTQTVNKHEPAGFFVEAGLGFGGYWWDRGGGPGIHGRVASGLGLAGPIAVSLEAYGSRDWADPTSALLAGPMATVGGALLLHVEVPLPDKLRSPGWSNEMWGIASGFGAVYLWRRVTDGPTTIEFDELGWAWPMRWYGFSQPPGWPLSVELFVELAVLVFGDRPVGRISIGAGIRW